MRQGCRFGVNSAGQTEKSFPRPDHDASLGQILDPRRQRRGGGHLPGAHV